MGEVVKAPTDFRHPRSVKPAEMYAQAEPPSEMVWELCPYTSNVKDDDRRCRHCPQWEEDEHHGKMQRMCYGLASEACRIVFAMQRREQ